jgi:hypothetical protein
VSAFSLNGTPLQRARVTVPRHGVWEGTCATAGVLDLAVGSAVSLVLGDLTMAGYVVAGGTFAGATESTYTLAGGAAGWTSSIPAWSLSSPTGVRLIDVAQRLAADAGEQFDLSSISSLTILGDHWQRPAGVASAALSQLFPLASGGWRVDPDGVTRVGPRPPAALPADLLFAVEDSPRDRRWARIGISDDRVSAFLPGTIITTASAPNISAPIVVGDLTIRADVDRVVVEVLGEGGLVEMIAALVQAFIPPPMLLGEYRYQVDSDSGAANLRAVSNAAGLPTVLACAKVFGVPGVTATLAAGATVRVRFADGNAARPEVVGFESSPAPTILGVAGATSTTLGGAAGSGAALALAQPLMSWIAGTLLPALSAHGITVAAPTGVATTNALGV